MTIATNREHLDNGSPGGCRVRGLAREVINPAGTTQTLTAGQSGALCVFDTAAGQIYTLPVIGANDVGMFFDFVVTVTGTSNAYSVDTGSSANFIGGGIVGASTTAGGGDAFPATIASHVSMDLDSAETGWLIGGAFTFTCISSTEWSVGGYTQGSGTIATPFA
jgi:hypothetical protein